MKRDIICESVEKAVFLSRSYKVAHKKDYDWKEFKIFT